MRKKLEMLAKGLLIASFFIPLVVVPDSFIFPFIVPKILLIRTASIFMLAVYVTLLITDSVRYKPRLDGVMIAVLAFIASFAISTFTGVDWYRSFYDNHERMLGLLTVMHYGFIYLVATSIFRTWDEWKDIFRWSLLGGAIVMCVGIAQRFDPELLLNRGSHRVASTLGNSIYHSGYGLFVLAIGLLLFLRDRAAATPWRVYYVAGAVLGFLGIFMGGTRGSALGLFAAIFVASFFYIISLKGDKYQNVRKGFIALLIFVIVGGALARVYRETDFVRAIPTIGKLANISISGGTANTRITAWSIAIESWKERPVFGWGPHNFYYAFNQHYRYEILQHGWGETWFDNAHNVLMNTLAVQGLAGVLAYLAMFGVGVYALWRTHKDGRISVHVFAISSGFLAAHFVHNFFVFENPTSYLYFFVFMAFVAAMTQPKDSAGKSSNTSPSVGLMVTMLLIGLVLAAMINLVPKRANNASLDIIRRLNSPEIVQNTDAILADFDKTLALQSPHIDDIRNDIARSMSGILGQLQQAAEQSGDERYLDIGRQVLEKAYDEQRKNLDIHPLDIRVHLQLAQILQQRAFLEQNVAYILEAEQLLREAMTYSPERQQLVFSIAPILMQQGKNDEAISLMRQAVDGDPSLGESWWRYLSVLIDTGNMDAAVEGLAEARALDVTFTPGTPEQIIAQIDAYAAASAGEAPAEDTTEE